MTAVAQGGERLSLGWPPAKQSPRRRLLRVPLWTAAIALTPLSFGCSRHLAVSSSTEQRSLLLLDSYFRELRTLQVNSDVGPLTLLFDTGGGATSVIPEVAHTVRYQAIWCSLPTKSRTNCVLPWITSSGTWSSRTRAHLLRERTAGIPSFVMPTGTTGARRRKSGACRRQPRTASSRRSRFIWAIVPTKS